MAVIYSSEEVIQYYALKGFFGIPQYPAKIVNVVISQIPGSIVLYSTITWMVVNTPASIYYVDFSAFFSSPARYNILRFFVTPFIWYGSVNVTLSVLYGNNAPGTIQFIKYLFDPSTIINTDKYPYYGYYIATVLTWTGTVTSGLVLTYSDTQYNYYGVFGIATNLSTVTVATIVVYYNINVNGGIFLDVYANKTVTIVSSNKTITRSVNFGKYSIPYFPDTSTVSLVLYLPGEYNYSIAETRKAILPYATQTIYFRMTIHTPYVTIYT
jgi:hypothetical protein